MTLKKISHAILFLSCTLVASAFEVPAMNTQYATLIQNEILRGCTPLDDPTLAGIKLHKYRSALVVNFDGEGITTQPYQQGVYFDHDHKMVLLRTYLAEKFCQY